MDLKNGFLDSIDELYLDSTLTVLWTVLWGFFMGPFGGLVGGLLELFGQWKYLQQSINVQKIVQKIFSFESLIWKFDLKVGYFMILGKSFSSVEELLKVKMCIFMIINFYMCNLFSFMLCLSIGPNDFWPVLVVFDIQFGHGLKTKILD